MYLPLAMFPDVILLPFSSNTFIAPFVICVLSSVLTVTVMVVFVVRALIIDTSTIVFTLFNVIVSVALDGL